jgi:hypothetical protein
MKQKDIERVMAAAWDCAEAPDDADTAFHAERLRYLLKEVDPNGAYRPASMVAMTGHDEPYVPLRQSPRMTPQFRPHTDVSRSMRRNPPSTGDSLPAEHGRAARPSRSEWPPFLIPANEAGTHD